MMHMTEFKEIIGQVKWFNNTKGYGFITVRSDCEVQNTDIFVHYSNISETCSSHYKYLVQGEYVQFDIGKAARGNHEMHALNVCGVLGGTLMCESKGMVTRERDPFSPENDGHNMEADGTVA